MAKWKWLRYIESVWDDLKGAGRCEALESQPALEMMEYIKNVLKIMSRNILEYILKYIKGCLRGTQRDESLDRQAA